MPEAYKGDPNPLEKTLSQLESFPLGHPMYKCAECGGDSRIHLGHHQVEPYLTPENIRSKRDEITFSRQLEDRAPRNLGELKQYGENKGVSQEDAKRMIKGANQQAQQDRITKKYFGKKSGE